MDARARKRISKKMSYVLRHRPDVMDLTLDSSGWVATADLLDGFARSNWELTVAEITEVVELNPKKRFEFNDDGSRIRARQGHSISVDLGYKPQAPPTVLYHGTPDSSQDAIQAGGLRKMSRHHVHLSPDLATAKMVGNRRKGKCVIFEVRAAELAAAGATFYRTDNDVWLVDEVPPEFLGVYQG